MLVYKVRRCRSTNLLNELILAIPSGSCHTQPKPFRCPINVVVVVMPQLQCIVIGFLLVHFLVSKAGLAMMLHRAPQSLTIYSSWHFLAWSFYALGNIPQEGKHVRCCHHSHSWALRWKWSCVGCHLCQLHSCVVSWLLKTQKRKNNNKARTPASAMCTTEDRCRMHEWSCRTPRVLNVWSILRHSCLPKLSCCSNVGTCGTNVVDNFGVGGDAVRGDAVFLVDMYFLRMQLGQKGCGRARLFFLAFLLLWHSWILKD